MTQLRNSNFINIDLKMQKVPINSDANPKKTKFQL